MARYKKTRIAVNDSFKDDKLFQKRNLQSVQQYVTPKFRNPTDDEIDSLEFYTHIWVNGDRFFKLAQKFYSDHRYWYIISLFNRIPSEGQVNIGDEIKIPVDLARAIEVLH